MSPASEARAAAYDPLAAEAALARLEQMAPPVTEG